MAKAYTCDNCGKELRAGEFIKPAVYFGSSSDTSNELLAAARISERVEYCSLQCMAEHLLQMENGEA